MQMKSCIMHVVEPDARPKKVGRILAELKAELEVCWLRILILHVLLASWGENPFSHLWRVWENF